MTRIPRLLAAAAAVVVAISLIVGKTVADTTPLETGWSTFAELAQPRAYAQAVALPSGEILVVGGLDQSDPLVTNAKSELIDPRSHAVEQLSQQLVGRLHQTVVLAAGERVISAGGVVWSGGYWSPVDRVDVFNVKTRRWTAGAPLRSARSDHAAVALKDGRVMVIGGNFDTKLLGTAEIYDPSTNAWTFTAPMPRARTQHAAVRLADGRVLVAGGIDTDGGATDTTFIYDPARDAWEDGPRMTQPRLQQATVLLPSGDVLFAGGDDAASSTSELYLAREDRFVASGTLVYPRLVAQAAALPDGRVVLNGGLPPRMRDYRPLSSTEIWDPASGQWSLAPSAAEGRAWGRLVLVRGALFLVSGTGQNESSLRTVERFLAE